MKWLDLNSEFVLRQPMKELVAFNLELFSDGLVRDTYVDLLPFPPLPLSPPPPPSLCVVLSAVRDSWSQVCDMTKPVYHKAMAGQHLCSGKFMSPNAKHFCLDAIFSSKSLILDSHVMLHS